MGMEETAQGIRESDGERLCPGRGARRLLERMRTETDRILARQEPATLKNVINRRISGSAVTGEHERVNRGDWLNVLIFCMTS